MQRNLPKMTGIAVNQETGVVKAPSISPEGGGNGED